MGGSVSKPDASTSPQRPMPPPRRSDDPTSPSGSTKPKRTWLEIEDSPASEADTHTPSRGKHLKNKPFSPSSDGRYLRKSPAGINSLQRSQENPSQRLCFDEVIASINRVGQSAQSPAALEPPSQPDEEVFNASAYVGTDATLDENQPPSPPQPPLDKNHWILQTIFGPVCTKCNTKLSEHGLFSAKRRVISKHWKANICWTGTKMPNASELERDLILQLFSLHERLGKTPESEREAAANAHVPGASIASQKNSAFCGRCGVTGKKTKLQKHHFTHKNAKCSILDLVDSGNVLTTVQGFVVPHAILTGIFNGSFKLPIDRPPSLKNPVPQLTAPSSETSTLPAASTATPALQIFAATDKEMEAVCKPSHVPTAVNEHDAAMSQLTCFGKHKDEAMKHAKVFIHLLQLHCPLDNKLRELFDFQVIPLSPSLPLKLLLKTGDLWLKSQKANWDVMNLGSDLRSMIYRVGSKVDNDPSKLDRQRGKTFIETPDVATIAKELQHLISFSVQSG